MANTVTKIIAIACVFTVLFIVISDVSLASPPKPSGPPDLPPPTSGGSSGGGGGGGGGGGSTYTPPVFNPYSVNLTSSDNSGSGSMSVKGYNLATVQAGGSVPVGDENASIGLTADLSSVPSTISLNIVPVNLSSINLPFDLNDFSSLLAFSLTRAASGSEWPMTAGTVHMTLRMPLAALNGIDLNSTFYLLKNDGTRLIMYSVLPVIENGTAFFDAPLYYETNSPSATGTFTLVGPKDQVISTSSATPTAVPATPTPKSGSNASLLLLIAALGIAAIFISRGRKQ